jgi:predicted nucleic acid-binding protein
MIFIDTGAFVARYVERDQHHAKAIAYWKRLAELNSACYTSNLVLSETLSLLARRTTYQFATQRAQQLYSSNALRILRPNAQDESSAVLLFMQYSTRKVSFCDCVSFVLMRRAGIVDAFSFDDDFTVAGFDALP